MPFARRCGLFVCAPVLIFAACSGGGNGGTEESGRGGRGVDAGWSGRLTGGSGSARGGGGSAAGRARGGVGGGGAPGATAGASGRMTAGSAGEGRAGAVGAAGTTPAGGSSGATSGPTGRAGTDEAFGGAGGEAGAESSSDGGGAEIPSGYVKAVIGVGYGGIRVVSRDGGNTWGDRVYAAPNGGDDDELLRAVVYGKGRWLASGWKLVTSDDGLHWTDHGKFHDGIIGDEQIIEGLAYTDGYFYAAGDGSPSRLYRSADGLTWSHFSTIGDTVKHTGLTFRGGVFVSYGDSNTSYRSSDGTTWIDMGIDEATYCDGKWQSFDDCVQAFWSDDGYYLIPEWGGDIRRSASGQNFKTVYSDDQKNTLYRSRAVAEGYVAPE